ncbi:glu leu phe val dehydrogenase family protein [Colletotrichum asianum]|uniref:Glu leu phe val dehydrogenase family protein n=1 Tax=Colletotrichum asianum TaxID=702518 RepID=A0A8H3WG72_9PEZI|nr:glu leu phe val dehydrogenase family protein [Colletotrichum asianum]
MSPSAQYTQVVTETASKRISAPIKMKSYVPAYDMIDGCCVWHWRDKESTAEGWIVIDSPVPTAAGRGLFLHANATFEEVRDVARSMSSKLAVSSQPQVVGAKGGIRFPSGDPQAPLVLERFIRDNAGVLSVYWGTGGDLNTDHAVIDKHARAYCSPGTSTALDALYRALGYTGQSFADIPALLEESIDNNGWSLSEYCVGYVMAVTLKELLSRADPSLMGRARLVLQGFGCAGATFALAAEQLGIGRVVAISSQYGFYIDNDGIDCVAIEHARRSGAGTYFAPGLDPRSLEAGLSQAELSSARYTPRKAGSSDEEHLANLLAAAEGEAFVPCAGRYVLTPKTISALINHTFAKVSVSSRFIVAGANNVFSPTESTEKTLSSLDSASVRMLPEWISNSGTSNLFMRACSGLALRGYSASNLEACANDTKSFINAVFAKIGSSGTNVALWDACHDLVMARRAAGAVNRLGVKRMSHLALTTPNVARAGETIERVYNARFNQDKTLYQLPGDDDPTLSIVRAPAGTGPGDIGLSMRFSVYNLARARAMLEADGAAFHEVKLEDGSNELVLKREEAGYPIRLAQAHARESSNSAFSNSSEALKSVAGLAYQLDHYAAIMPDATKMKSFHEYMMAFTHLRTFTVNAGSGTNGEDDGLMHVMGLPFDTKRVLILTEGLNQDAVFTKLMNKHCGAYVHHIALEIEDVDAVFAEVREQGWQTTTDAPSTDLATGLRQFFLKEEETGWILELIGRGKEEEALAGAEAVEDAAGAGGYATGQGQFRTDNIVALARSLDA